MIISYIPEEVPFPPGIWSIVVVITIWTRVGARLWASVSGALVDIG